MTSIDPLRHLQFFDPRLFGTTQVDVIGCGAVGSRIAMEMARLGVRHLHLWDGDRIEPHNIANQIYRSSDIGRYKVDALADLIADATNVNAVIHDYHVEGREPLGRVVFLAVDSMSARKKIFQDCLRLKLTTDVVIETRMGAEEVRVYGFNPRSRDHILAWEQTLYEDEVTVENACRTQVTIGATAAVTAGLAVHRFLKWFRRDMMRDPASLEPQLEEVLMLRPLVAITN